MEDGQWVKETLQNNFESLEIHRIEKLGEGWMSRAYLVNGEIVFRFPKNEQGALDTEKEIRVLPLLKDYLTLAIPDFLYKGTQINSFPFVGYPLLPGEPLDEDQFQNLPDRVKKKIGRQLGQLMDEMQSFDLRTAEELGVEEAKTHHYYNEKFEEVQKKIYPDLDEEMKVYISSLYSCLLENEDYFNNQPILLHADLSCDHLLFDRKKGQLTGIIDFGDLQIRDPDFEYIYLYEECGEEFTREVMKERQESHISSKIEKVHLLLLIESVNLLLAAKDKGDSNFIAESLTFIREEMRSYPAT